MEILSKGTASAQFQAVRPKLCGNGAILQNFNTKNLHRYFTQCINFKLSTVNYLDKIAPSQRYDMVLNTPLQQRLIQSPVSHLRWSVLQKLLTVLAFDYFSKALHLGYFEQVSVIMTRKIGSGMASWLHSWNLD